MPSASAQSVTGGVLLMRYAAAMRHRADAARPRSACRTRGRSRPTQSKRSHRTSNGLGAIPRRCTRGPTGGHFISLRQAACDGLMETFAPRGRREKHAPARASLVSSSACVRDLDRSCAFASLVAQIVLRFERRE